tara:strand:- start:121 stop:384 length:264 start_codon:yes stop_codon:yes gene_type:complete
MLKELKFLLYLSTILLFIFFCIKIYFSDLNKKRTYRTFSKIDLIIAKKTKNLISLKNNTNNIIDYIDKENDKKKKKYFFWNLLKKND